MVQLTILLEDENGKPVEILSGILFLPLIDESDFCKYKLLKYVDPYGDIVFNNLQIEDLIQDLYLIKLVLAKPETIDPIVKLAKKCKNGVHLYLRFAGD